MASKGSSSQCWGVQERVAASDVEVAEVDVVQEHVDAGEVIGRGVDLLAKEALPHVLGAQELRELEQQRARAAGRVVDLVHMVLVANDDTGQKLRDLLRGEELAARLARAARVHRHEVLVSVAEQVYLGVLHAPEVEVADALDDLGEAGVALGEVAAELVARYVDVVEEALEVVLGLGAHAGALDGLEDLLHVDVELGVLVGRLGDVAEELRGQDEVALLARDVLAGHLRHVVGKFRIGERVVARGLALALVDVLGQVLRYEAVEEEAQDVGLEVPAVYRPADLVGDAPDRLVELGALRLPVSHGCQLEPSFPPKGRLSSTTNSLAAD